MKTVCWWAGEKAGGMVGEIGETNGGVDGRLSRR